MDVKGLRAGHLRLAGPDFGPMPHPDGPTLRQGELRWTVLSGRLGGPIWSGRGMRYDTSTSSRLWRWRWARACCNEKDSFRERSHLSLNICEMAINDLGVGDLEILWQSLLVLNLLVAHLSPSFEDAPKDWLSVKCPSLRYTPGLKPSLRARSPRPGGGPDSPPNPASSRAAQAGTPSGCRPGRWDP